MSVSRDKYVTEQEMHALFVDAAHRAGERAEELLGRRSPNDGMYFAELSGIYTDEAKERWDILARALLPLKKRREIAAKVSERAGRCFLDRARLFGIPAGDVDSFLKTMNLRLAALQTMVSRWEEVVSDRPRALRTIEQRQAARFRILETAYEMTEGNPHGVFNRRDISRKLHLSENDTLIEAQWLVDEGLLEHLAMGGDMAITHEGIKEVEAMRTEPKQGTSYFPPLSQVTNVFFGPVGVAQSGSGNIEIRDSVLTVLEQVNDEHALDFRHAIRELVDGIVDSDHLRSDKKEAALQLTVDIVEEAAREKPKRRWPVVTATCAALAAILGAAVKLAELWKRVEPAITKIFL